MKRKWILILAVLFPITVTTIYILTSRMKSKSAEGGGTKPGLTRVNKANVKDSLANTDQNVEAFDDGGAHVVSLPTSPSSPTGPASPVPDLPTGGSGTPTPNGNINQPPITDHV
jgi:hypothetical protein